MYDLPQLNFTHFRDKFSKILNNKILQKAVFVIIILVVIVFYADIASIGYIRGQINSIFHKIENNLSQPLGLSQDKPAREKSKPEEKYVSDISYEQAIIDSVKNASPSVVSIIISKNLPVYEQQFIDPFEDFPDFGVPFNFQIPKYVQKGTELKEIGAGSGFIVSEDGLVLTNKHVVIDKDAEYTVLTNDGKKYPAKVLALDPVQDLAIIKISRSQSDQGSSTESGQSDKNFPAIKLGNSSGIQIGQTAIAIGNALGEFRNTVSVGVISGLGRTISASSQQGFSEILEDVIQVDAAINPGNSGGPLLNLKGEVIGINTAMAEGAESIGFAIPINIAKRDISQVIEQNKISYPFLGIRYVLVDDSVKQKYNLSVDYGAFVLKGSNGEPAITAGSAAEKSGLKEKDIILEFNAEKITQDNSLTKMIAKYSPGDKITLKVLRDGAEINIDVVLGERN